MDPNSNPYWAGSDVRLTTAEQLASFTVEIRISAGSGPVTSTNSFTDIPGGLPAVVSAQPDGSLLYRWTLTGRVLPPGTYTFGAQFNHPRGTRDTTADRWTVDASGAVGTAALPPLTGHF
ncbi:hypothetical protein [Actinacidiphila yeochonensis]|uniref:hypothetical protein n=1 Tax=Actinacidiphila yeochonensis TaxID=89050 RepID=UPI00069220E0|nr:hypothetical protein [Actinacidiphila yeochonensis]